MVVAAPPGAGDDRRVGIDAIVLPVDGWRLVEDTPTLRRWLGDHDDQLALSYFAAPDPMPIDPHDADDVRRFARALAVAAGGGLIEADRWRHTGHLGMRSISKLPQTPSGFTYVGDLIGQRQAGFAIKLECREAGTTGLRETAVALELGIDPAPGPLARWFGRGPRWEADLYDPRLRAPVMRTQADDPRWDARFPDHPLSRVRRHLAAVAAGMRVTD